MVRSSTYFQAGTPASFELQSALLITTRKTKTARIVPCGTPPAYYCTNKSEPLQHRYSMAQPEDIGTWNYGDIELPGVVKKEILEGEVRNFEVRDDDIWLCTYPKTGTNWTLQIIRLLQCDGDFDKMVANALSQGTIPGPIETSVRTPDGDFNHAYKYFQEMPSPRFLGSHLPLSLMPKQLLEKKPKVIYVARNPKDNAVSMYHFVTPMMQAFGVDIPWEAFIEMYMLGKLAYGPWASHVVPFWEHRNDPNFLFLKYEDMKADHTEAVRKIATHLGYSPSEDVIRKTVENSTAKRTKDALKLIPKPGLVAMLGVGDIVRKGVVGDWKSLFTVAQNEAFDAAIKKDLDGTTLTVDY